MVRKLSFWKDKKVLITGHTGFKGGWLSICLQHLGAKVIGVAIDPPTEPNLYTVANVSQDMTSLYEDIRNGDAIKDIFKLYKPEILFHLAAQPLVRYSYQEPVETYETNVMGTLNILEGMRSINTVRSAVFVTTDKCYENKERTWGYKEDEPMGGHDPYSSSKAASELLIASYRNSYYPCSEYYKHETAIASARAGNVIGGGDWAEDRLVTDIIRALSNNTLIKIRNPKSIRPWQHVLDLVFAYLLLGERLFTEGSEYAEAWNFGPKEENSKSVEWLVEKLTEEWGYDKEWVVDDSDFHEATLLMLDCSKAHKRLNWYPVFSLEQTLKNIVSWYKDHSLGKNMRANCIAEIKEHIKLN